MLAPFGGSTPLTPLGWGLHLGPQADALRAGGSLVEVVIPDADAQHLFGANAMDHSQRPAAARAGHGQGTALAERLGGSGWS